ncbi:MAG TPA: lamin tail domain-containing protein [Candidatus Dojkabacteria bacterium]|nr:lamin tail domain-containing protein [Candidatus Dojkabacteria bacterium]
MLPNKLNPRSVLSILLWLNIFFQNINLPTYASSSIIINEILYDPVGTDSGYEWIELYNPLSTSITLTGWKIQVAGTTFVDTTILPTTTIQPNTYLLVCESKVVGCDVYVTKLALQNGGDSTDGVQILDAKGNVVDTVLYDDPNSNNLTNEQGVVALNNQTATPSASGESLGRKNMIDTDNSHSDFYVFSSPTPKAANPTSDELQPAGEVPVLILFILLFILLTYSDRLKQYRITLSEYLHATFKDKSNISSKKNSS